MIRTFLQYWLRTPKAQGRPPWTSLCLLPVLLLLLVQCTPSGDSNQAAPPVEPNQPLQQQTVDRLLDLYRSAIVQEDIDQLQTLLQSDATPLQRRTRRQAETRAEAPTFRATLSTAFRTLTMTDLQIPAETIEIAPDARRVTFLEVESVEDSATLLQQTHLYHTTFDLTQDVAQGVVTVRISAVQRQGPLVRVTTHGQVQAGALTRLEVDGSDAPFVVTGVDVEVPETGVVQALTADGNGFHGLFTAPQATAPQPLRVRLRGRDGAALVLSHRYRLRRQGQGVVEHLPGTEATRLFAVTVAPNGAVWTGGDAGGSLYQVAPGTSTVTPVGQLLTDPIGRVEDLVVDQLGRLHAVVVAPQASGVIVLDQGRLCQTVNVVDPRYPFLVRDAQTGALQPSPSARALAAEAGDIWLFGSDAGVARVADAFRDGQCPETGVDVRYAPVFRREAGELLSNTVPAFAVGADGTLAFGTAFGLTQLQNQQFTPRPFDPVLSLRGDVTTLEAFFRDVAQAIFEAQPLTSVHLGQVSFVTAFGQPLVKEDLIFSAVVDRQNRLWVGTLGGGLRRLEAGQETLHLTRGDGLSSNLIFALAVGPEDTIWAATEEGVSRIQDVNGTVTITTFTATDGLRTPVRDIAMDGTGTVWVATDAGLFRIVESGGVIQGVVLDTAGQPVAGADITVVDTPFRAVTDAAGRFTLVDLPPGAYRLQVDGRLATDGPLAQTSVEVTVTTGRQGLEPVVLPAVSRQLMVAAGDGQTGVVGVPLPLPLTVTVTDTQGNPVAGIPVMFTVVAGQGTLSPAMAATGADGRAASSLTLGATTGPIHVQASADGQTVVFTATGVPGVIRVRLLEVSGNRQVVAPGEVLPQPLVVRLEDQFGDPVVGARLTATIIQGTGELIVAHTSSDAAVSVPTDAQGEAAFRLRMGASEADIVVEVAVPALPDVAPVQFVAIVGFQALRAIASDATGGLVVTDERLQGVLRLDPASGDRVIVSDTSTGRGPAFAAPVGLAVQADGRLAVLDVGLAAVVRVDSVSGERTIVSDATIGRGPRLITPIALALETAGHLVVLDVGLVAVVRVDARSGDRTIVSDATIGRGPRLVTPTAVAVEATGHLVVLDSVLDAVVRVEPVSGERSIVSDATIGRGPLLRVPVGLAVEADGSLVLVDSVLDAVVRVDAVSGERTIVSDATTGGGPLFANPVALTVEADGRLAVVDHDLGTVVRVDPRSGERTIVARAALGNGSPFADPGELAVEADGQLLVVDSGLAAVIRVEPASGDRTIVSDATTGGGPAFRAPHDIAVEAAGRIVVLDGRAVVRVELGRGERSIVSDDVTGRGLAFEGPVALAVEANGQLLVVEGAIGIFAGVLRVDPVSGDRTVVSGPTTGRGPLFIAPLALAIEATGQLVVVDSVLGAVLRVDPVMGDRTIVSDASTGQGPAFGVPAGIAVAADGQLLVVDQERAAVLRVDPGSGDRVIISGGPTARGSGPPLSDPVGLAVEADGRLLVVDEFFRWVLRVEPGSGNRTLLSQ
jgi:sugar lactone lactonase YvrE